jgi:V/A-type H+-transporting ATPase subunit E
LEYRANSTDVLSINCSFSTWFWERVILVMHGLAKVVDEVAGKIIESLDSSFQELSGDVRKIIERELEETLRIVDEMVEQAEKKSEMIKSRIQSLTQVKIRGKKLEQIEECVDELIRKVLELVGEKAVRRELDKYLEKILEEAIDIVNVRNVKVYTNEHLRESLRRISENLSRKKNIEITIMDEPVETVFGVIVKSIDGSISFDNRIETKLERIKPQIRKTVATLIS